MRRRSRSWSGRRASRSRAPTSTSSTRSNGLAAARLAAVRSGLASAEKQTGTSRRTALTQLAADLSKDAAGAPDQAKVKLLSEAVKDLAAAQH